VSFRNVKRYIAAAAVCSLLPLAAANDDPAADLAAQVKKFVTVFSKVESSAADPVNIDRAIYGGAIPGMLSRLDPHSTFLDPQQAEQLKQMEHSESKGFGSVVSVLPGRVIILQTLPGTPSARAGLSPGDEILVINGIPLNRLDFDQLVGLLTEARQHPVKIYVHRPGESRLLDFTLVPELMESPSVDRAFLLRPGIAYVRATSFDPQTGKLIHDSIEKLGGAKLQGLVLDLRNNPGGVVEAALETASLFLKPGQKILSVRGRRVKANSEVNVPNGATPYTFPMAVLVNGRTASAAEIVTGALQDHDRARVFGETSYGKGLVQSVYNLTAGTALALTTAFYYTPSGRSIQKPLATGELKPAEYAPQGEFHTDDGRPLPGGGGIQPDVVVEPPSPTRLQYVLDASGSYTSYAAQYVKTHKVGADFQVTPGMLDDFQVFLSQRNIQPSLSEWLTDKDKIENRLQEEIVTIGAGVEKGDELELRHDPVVLRALAGLTK
jgi:carboxyl-terminal processing protease